MRARIFACGAAALLSACGLGPNFTAPAAPADKGYTEESVPAMPPVKAAGTEQRFALGEKINAEWWTLFKSPQLDEVLKEAVAGNRDLAAATASLAEAHEAVAVAAGGFYPQLDFGASATRQRLNYQAEGLKAFPPTEFDFYSFGPTVSYSFDINGLTVRRVEEERALEQSQNYQLEAAYLTLTGGVVAEAITIASIRAQIEADQDIVADDQSNLELVQKQLQAGAATNLDIETATSQLAADRTLLPPLLQQLSTAQHALAILIGKSPAGWTPPDFDLAQLTLPGELPVSLPSALVRQRPDILMAEAQLHAASAQVGVATAQLYPNVTLGANLMQEFLKPDTIFDPASNIWSVGLDLAAPIFHGGELQAQKRAAEDAYEATLDSYEQTVLAAFGQVADLLDGLAHDAQALAAERDANDSAESAVQLNRTSYALGNSTLLQVVDAERILQQARVGLARAEAQRYLDTAQLYVAMGGGWWDRPIAKTVPTLPGP